MAANDNFFSEALQLTAAAKNLAENEETILASADDCEYFRHLVRAKKEKPAPTPAVPSPPLILEPPKDLPIEKPAPENDLEKFFSKALPEMKIVSDIPSDLQARQVANRWKTKNLSAPFSILSFRESLLQKKILINLASAIDATFGLARLIEAENIEKENQWETFLSVPELKLVIMSDCALWQMPHLLSFYRELSNKSERFLQKTPLLLLPDLTLIVKDPLLKKSLWEAICQKMI